MDPDRIPDSFPAPEYRGNQRAALERIREAFAAGNEAVLVRAPTGSGKSLLARAVAGAARPLDENGPTTAVGAYYTTPQVSQLEDVEDDPLLSDLQHIRGKGNYTCILPGEEDTPVDRAPCVRESGYDCSVRHRCPYYSARSIAANRGIAAMTLAYFMRTAGSDTFGRRDVVVIDEAHGLAEWAEMYATIELAPRTVPIWEDVRTPDVAAADDPVERTARFADRLTDTLDRRLEDLRAQPELTPEEAARRDRLAELRSELSWFVTEYRDPQSSTTWVVDQQGDPGGGGSPSGNGRADGGGGAGGGAGAPLTIKPLNPERFLQHTVWDRGDRFALLSATILNKAAFCRGVGLDPEEVALVDVEHTFPVENRPLYDVTRGKMTYEHRDDTLPKIARLLVRLMARHPDEKGLVHAHSYAIADRLAERLDAFGVGGRVRTHGRDDREAALAGWQASDDPDLFVSVKMEEALDLEGDLARWQVLCKAPYLNTGDSRVARRLEDGQWGWYYRTALRTVIQACGRVVRSPDDRGATYLADASLLDLFERARADVPDWFAAQVDRMSTPDLPEFDPEAALAAVDATPDPDAGAGRTRSRSRTSTDRERGSSAGRSAGASAGSGGGRGGGSAAGGRSEGSSAPSDVDDAPEDHPLYDVWGE